MTTSTNLNAWARLAARLHDPPEKALILMRTQAGHEGGTTRALLEDIFPGGMAKDLAEAVRKADHWASAADRAAFPNEEGGRRWPAWQQVRFAERPVVIHPLTGMPHELLALAADIDPAAAQALGTSHLRSLIQKQDGTTDAVSTALAFWRFGSELPGELANVWRQLPADSRVPDHTIHDHLDLTAALAGSFANGDQPVLMAVSIGPVQEFIAAARSTSDLWAGSHFLSRLAWEAMRAVCERFGPEAIVFPRLRGVPQVDLWLQRDMRLAADLFKHCDWRMERSDANPLFAAALPNRFTALVPESAVEALGEAITQAARAFTRNTAGRALEMLLDVIGEPMHPNLHAVSQLDRQLEGFPEVHWACVPWSLATEQIAQPEGGGVGALAAAMQPFMGAQTSPGFLGHPTWGLLSGGLEIEKGWFWRPNPGSLYPALHELLDRALSAAKTTRVFGPEEHLGWRCALTGETEWITLNPADLTSSYRTRTDTLWAKVAARKPSWARRGEHLGALPMLKRLWPDIFVAEISPVIGMEGEIRRYVVSTHTMAMASSLLGATEPASMCRLPAQLVEDLQRTNPPRVALPRKLSAAMYRHPDRDLLRLLPGWLEREHDGDEASKEPGAEGSANAQAVRKRIGAALGASPDNYYGLLMLDGDSMGGWLSADARFTRPIRESYHPQIRQALDSRFGASEAFRQYANAKRPPNPAWHMAISEALNHFALLRAPAIVEEQHLGRLIYAGGDDVLAMVAASDLMSAAAALRAAYSGIGNGSGPEANGAMRSQGNGWALHNGRVLRLMGAHATTSCGLVVAHHQAPLTAVMKTLREAEKRAKGEGGRDAWSLTLLKRSGGSLQVTAKWSLLAVFDDLRRFLGSANVSRRAAYNILGWFADVPRDRTLVESMLSFRMRRQTQSLEARSAAAQVARKLVSAAFDQGQRPAGVDALHWLRDFMLAAEFMAREVRHDTDSASNLGMQA